MDNLVISVVVHYKRFDGVRYFSCIEEYPFTDVDNAVNFAKEKCNCSDFIGYELNVVYFPTLSR